MCEDKSGKIAASQPGTCQGGREGADPDCTLSVEEAWLKKAITVPYPQPVLSGLFPPLITSSTEGYFGEFQRLSAS